MIKLTLTIDASYEVPISDVPMDPRKVKRALIEKMHHLLHDQGGCAGSKLLTLSVDFE